MSVFHVTVFAEAEGCDFCYKLFDCIGFVSKRILYLPRKPADGSSRMGHLMECGGEELRLIQEERFEGNCYLVRSWTIRRNLGGVRHVVYAGRTVRQHCFCQLFVICRVVFHILSWRNRIELSCIENVIDLEDWRNTLGFINDKSVLILDDVPILILLRLLYRVLEEICRSRFLSLADMASDFVCLVECVPAHVAVVEEKRGDVQHQGISTAVVSV